MLYVYGAWIVLEIGLIVTGRKKIAAFAAFARTWKGR
jgi:hypothetical protein